MILKLLVNIWHVNDLIYIDFDSNPNFISYNKLFIPKT